MAPFMDMPALAQIAAVGFVADQFDERVAAEFAGKLPGRNSTSAFSR
jgi:hypothetical protein